MSKKRLLIYAEIIFFAALGVIMLLAFLLTQTTFREDTIASKLISTAELEKDIERSLSFGKTYTQNTPFLRSIETTISPVAEDIHLREIVFTDNNHEILYTYSTSRQNTFLSQELPEEFYSAGTIHEIVEYGGLLWIGVPLETFLFHRDEETVGTFTGAYFIAFDPTDFEVSPSAFLQAYILPFALIFLIGSLAICFCIFTNKLYYSTKEHVIKNNYLLFLIILFSQLVLSVILIRGMYFFFLDNARLNLENNIAIENQKILRLLELGLPIDEYRNAESFFAKELSTNENIHAFQIIGADNEEYLNLVLDDSPLDLPPVVTNLVSSNNEVYGYVQAYMSSQGIFDRTLSAIADVATIFIISFLAVTEVLLFIALPSPKKNTSAEYVTDPLIPVHYMRTAFSMFTFATALALSFLPLKMLSMLDANGTINPLIASGLPTSAEYIACLFSLLLVNKMSRRYGWQASFLLGCLLYALASLLSALAQTPMALVAARALAGFAYGFAWLSPQVFTLALVPPNKKAMAFALTTAGIYTGYIAGVSTGGILAAQSSAESTFMFAALVCVASSVFVFTVMKPYFIRIRKSEDAQLETHVGENKKTLETVQNSTGKTLDFIGYIFNKNIFTATFFILIPFSLVQIGLLNFAVPITLTELGFSSSSIGRAIMIYGMVQIYLAPSITKRFENVANKKIIIVSGVFIAFVGFLLTNFNPYMLFVAIFFLGIAGALVGPSQSSFTSNQEATSLVSIEKSVSFQRFADKSGQALGPLIFAALFSTFSYSIALTFVGSAFLGLGALFALIAKEKK